MQSTLQLVPVLFVKDQLPVDDVVEVSKPMLDRYKGTCMVSIININNGFKEPTHGYQNYNTGQILNIW
jgi:hypothetical protein